jgi:hypothetical protein
VSINNEKADVIKVSNSAGKKMVAVPAITCTGAKEYYQVKPLST